MIRSIRCSLLLLLLILVDAGPLFAQTPAGPSNEGREFLLSLPANWDTQDPGRHARFYITCRVATQVRFSSAGSQIRAVKVVPDQITTVDLPLHIAQAYAGRGSGSVPPDQIYTNKGVRVESDEPILLTVINHVIYSNDALLALPTAALGRDYIIASATSVSERSDQKTPSQYVITAAYDNTVVTIINSYDTYGHVAGEVVTLSLMKGDVYAAGSQGNLADLSGTTITSSRPVAVVAGHFCAILPFYGAGSCDYLVEMVPPVTSWGKVYHLMPIATRTKGDMVRVFAGAPDARIFMNGDQVALLKEKGGNEGIAWATILPENPLPMQFVSDKPIYVAQYNNSSPYNNSDIDPFFMGVPPLEQYQREFLFMTPAADHAENYINLAVDSASWGSIEIASGLSGEWKNLSVITGVGVKSYPTLIDGVRYVGATVRIAPGIYRLRGPRPFGGNLYGWTGQGVASYGQPLPASAFDLTIEDTVAPRITSTQDCRGNVVVTVMDGPIVDAKRSNLSTIELDPATFNYAFDPRPAFDPGRDWVATFALSVSDPKKDAMAIIVVGDGRGNVTRDTLVYSAFNMTLTGDAADFGFMNANAPAPRRELLLRNLASRPVTIRELIVKFADRGFHVVDPVGEFTVAAAGMPGDTKIIMVEFDPTVPGTLIDSIGVRDECGPQMLAQVRATVGMPRIQVDDASFGPWSIDSPLPAVWYIKIRNRSTDGGVLIVSGVAHGPSQPLVFQTPDGYPVFPLRIESGRESDPIRVTFDPTEAIPYIDSIRFTHNAGPGASNDSIAVLTGQGTTTTTGVETGGTAGLSLGPIAPTPTDGWATLSYQVPSAVMVEITLVDLGGRTVATVLQKSAIAAGSHTLRFDLSALPAGSYFCRMRVGDRLLVYPVVVR